MLFGNKRKAFTNALTTAIDKNKNITIEDILLHQDLSNTIRNESDVLYNKIFDNENKYLNEIFQYALFNKKAPEEYQKYNNINQINHNASNFLESCGKRFISRVKESSLDLINKMLDEFISDNNTIRLNQLYAGHFQRFIENFMRLNAFNNLDDILGKIAPFIIENCRILAYQQLITRILADFSMNIDNKAIYSFLTKILARAYGAVKYIREKSEEKLKESVYYSQITYYKKQKVYNIDQQPLSFKGVPIPLLEDIIKESDYNTPSLDDDEFNINWKEEIDNNITFNNIDDAEIEAYLLIMSIRTAMNEQQELLGHFRDDADDYQLVESLLYCGTQCNETSLISLESFKLLDIIFNGSIGLSIEPWMLLEKDKEKLKFYNKYADTFYFSPRDLTYQMIHALPIFWNHRYNSKNYILSEEEKKQVKVSDYFSDIQKDKKMKRKREKGETAIEIVQPCLICEPPLSSVLIYTVTNIFVMLSEERKRLRQIEDQTIEIRERMLYIDGAYYDFYTHHFSILDPDKNPTSASTLDHDKNPASASTLDDDKNPASTSTLDPDKNPTSTSTLDHDKNPASTSTLDPDKNPKSVRILDLLDDIIPLPSIDKKCRNDEKKRRAPLSGFIIDFFLRMNNSDINTFFDVSDNVPLTDLAHTPAMKEVSEAYEAIYNYRDMLNYDKTPKYILYNIPIHNEFSFGNDNAEEEDIEDKNIKRTKIIVDELDKKSRKKKRQKKNKTQPVNQQQTENDQSNTNNDQQQTENDQSNTNNDQQQTENDQSNTNNDQQQTENDQSNTNNDQQQTENDQSNTNNDQQQTENDQSNTNNDQQQVNTNQLNNANDQQTNSPATTKVIENNNENSNSEPKIKINENSDSNAEDNSQNSEPKKKSKTINKVSSDEESGSSDDKPKRKPNSKNKKQEKKVSSDEESGSNDDKPKIKPNKKQKKKVNSDEESGSSDDKPKRKPNKKQQTKQKKKK